ncbi:MAG: hypothetical protein JO316_11835 [Abitibacteriaceae bacterium]|nr:hypothetical protein [Abditibacteriaceae bacterium]MBV9866035.1 hypothetical protein [Abditibacteriaceae bacterium]
MRLTGLGKVAILILVAGLAIGGMKWWQQQQGAGRSSGPGWNFKLPNIGKGAGGSNGSSGSGSNSDIEFVITAAKKDWVQDQVDHFNGANSGKWHIVTKAIPSREAMHAILEGKENPSSGVRAAPFGPHDWPKPGQRSIIARCWI